MRNENTNDSSRPAIILFVFKREFFDVNRFPFRWPIDSQNERIFYEEILNSSRRRSPIEEKTEKDEDKFIIHLMKFL